jgi:hypothetical protein
VSGQTTYWLALDLGCALLKTFTDYGPPASSEKFVEAVAPGEPSDSLFDVPSRFREVPPSVLFHLREHSAAERFDAQYWVSRPQ